VRTEVLELEGKRLFVLNGLIAAGKSGEVGYIEALKKLVEAIKRDPDAVAFGCISGKWVAAA
jgi:hypothetical protein